MKKLTENQWRWILVVVFILLPFVLVRVISQEEIVRIIGIITIFIFFPVFLFIAVFVSDKKFLRDPDAFERRYGPNVLKWFGLGMRIVAVGGSTLIFVWGTIPVSNGFYHYLILREPPQIADKVVVDLDAGLFDPFGIIAMSVQIGDKTDETYTYWYPSERLQIGEKYRFKILPSTDIILDSEKID